MKDRNSMKDRYLFRGKRIDNGEWVVGAFIEGFDDCDFIHTTCGKYRIPDLIKVDPSTICQCTGLKDKNGKLIFENDILSGHIDDEYPEDETRKRVVWHENGWCTNEYGCEDYKELDDFDSENFEVIGNVVDNSELFRGVGMAEKLIKSYEDAIDCLKKSKPTSGFYMLQKSVDMAIKALEEIQQYRAIGTVEECRATVEKTTGILTIDEAKTIAAKAICIGCEYLTGCECNYKGGNCVVSKPMLESVSKSFDDWNRRANDETD